VKVHHLNCGTLYPLGCGHMVCHVLLVETDNGLVLVDTGFGTHDCADPADRLGPARRFIRPALNRDEAAINQVERLGFSRDDVRHIVITHFDPDHIGGISDFPDAQIHVTALEARSALRAPSLSEKLRFRAVQWAHGPKIVEHTPHGETWLHCGDAFFHHGTIDGTARMPRALAAFETMTAFDRKMVRQNHSRLVELSRRRDPDILLVCSHDRKQYERAKATA
jgi:phosphoribosyl 1,2-cyclic phosphodiesterase